MFTSNELHGMNGTNQNKSTKKINIVEIRGNPVFALCRETILQTLII